MKTDNQAPQRYRCNACGNLTRFDVTQTLRTKEFHHFSVGGELAIDDTEILQHDIERVECRWCASAEHVVTVAPEDWSQQVENTPQSV